MLDQSCAGLQRKKARLNGIHATTTGAPADAGRRKKSHDAIALPGLFRSPVWRALLQTADSGISVTDTTLAAWRDRVWSA